jgi:CHAD domain-containing protein
MDAAPGPPIAAEPDPSPAPRRLVLELALEPDEARRLPRLLHGSGPASATALRLIWHDTADFALAADGRTLLEHRRGRRSTWRLERLTGPSAVAPHPALAEGSELAELNAALPAPLVPMVRFAGRVRRRSAPDEVEVAVLAGTLEVSAASRRCCRAVLAGPPGAVAELADRLAARLHLSVPAASLAAEALAFAGRQPARRRRASPAAPPDHPVGEAFAFLVGRFAEILLHEAAQATPAMSEPVHQMRIAVRRLRSAIGLFDRATRCPELAAGKAGLRLLAGALGPARDWDVFVGDTGRAVAAAFAGEARVQRLLRAAERHRLAAYATLQHYLASAEFRRMVISLAVLAEARPWEAAGIAGDAEAARRAELQTAPMAGFAARALEKRLRRLHALLNGNVETLPAETLHRLRLSGKRLRYAAEFFVPSFSGRGAKRFVRRLARLQEHLGHLNDAAVAASLMAKLGPAHAYAGGVVRGFVAARSAGAREQVGRAWRKFARLGSFWD